MHNVAGLCAAPMVSLCDNMSARVSQHWKQDAVLEVQIEIQQVAQSGVKNNNTRDRLQRGRRLCISFKMAGATAAPSRRRFGALRRMFRAAQGKGMQSRTAADRSPAEDGEQLASPETSQRSSRQKPARLEIEVMAEAATPAAAQWQLRDNSVYSPVVRPPMDFSCLKVRLL